MKIFEVVAEEMPENHSKIAWELAIFVSDFLVEEELQWKMDDSSLKGNLS